MELSPVAEEPTGSRSTFSDMTAEVYELSNAVDGRYRDVDHYVSTLRALGGRALELACGNGRILVPVLQAGVAIDGLDHSSAMVQICRERAARVGCSPQLMTADMSRFTVEQSYDVVIAAAGVIKELPGRSAALACLRSCYEALVPEGKLFIDLVPQRYNSLAASPARPTEPASPRYWRRGDVIWTVETVLLDYDASTDRTVALRRYQKSEHGRIVATELHEFILQHWGLDAFGDLVEDAGFVVEEVYADYEPGRAPGSRDRDWTFRARRP